MTQPKRTWDWVCVDSVTFQSRPRGVVDPDQFIREQMGRYQSHKVLLDLPKLKAVEWPEFKLIDIFVLKET